MSFAHKPGAVSNAKTDAGIMFFQQGPVALCVLTANNKDVGYAVDNAGNILHRQGGQSGLRLLHGEEIMFRDASKKRE